MAGKYRDFFIQTDNRVWTILMKKAFTLIEVVVAIGIFAVLSVVSSLLLVGVLRGSKKAAAVILVRGEGAYATESMAAQLRFGKSITSCTGSGVTAKTKTGADLIFECLGDYLASNSARLTTSNVRIVSCANVFTCPDAQTVRITFSLQKAGSNLPLEGTAGMNWDIEVGLRNQ